MRTTTKKENDNEKYYTKYLRNIIGHDKVELLLRIYRFIEAKEKILKDSKQNIPVYPIEKIKLILREILKLKKSGWLEDVSIFRIIKLIHKEMLFSKNTIEHLYQRPLLDDFYRLMIKCQNYKELSTVYNTLFRTYENYPLGTRIMPEKRGRKPRDDADRILLFCTYTLLKKTSKRLDSDMWITSFFEEQKIKHPGSISSIRSARRDLKKSNIKSVYEKYYHDSIRVKTIKGKIFLFTELPSWGDIFK